MAALPKTGILPAEYLALDRQAGTRSEYIDGEMVAMSGASMRHNMITSNIIRELGTQLKPHPCRVLPSDMRVYAPDTGNYLYPDVTVVCGPPQLADARLDILLNPTVLVEVLSESTEAHDRGRKFEGYRGLPSLREYLLVAQAGPHVERYVRQPNGDWTLTDFHGLDAVVRLPSLDCDLPLAEVYDKVDFAETTTPD